MCGRFTLTINIQTVASTIMGSQQVAVPQSLQENQPRYNIAPTQDIVAVMNDDSLHLDVLRWGLIPSWAKDAAIGSKMINARAETLAEKPSFKRLLTSKRCLVVADGFYEWRQETGARTKTPMYITLKDHQPIAFAGLWDSWHDPDGQLLRTCTIITTEPNELMSSIHNRMPVLLPLKTRELWLDPTMRDQQRLVSVLTPYPTEEMQVRTVSRLVNDPKHDSAELIA